MTSWDIWWFMWHNNYKDRWKLTVTVLLVVVLIVTFLSMMAMTAH